MRSPCACMCMRSHSATASPVYRILYSGGLAVAMGNRLPSQRYVAERRDPRIPLAPPAVDEYPNGPIAMPSGYMLAPRPSDSVPATLDAYGVAAYKRTGLSEYRLHFCSGSFTEDDLRRYAKDLKHGRLTTINSRQVWCIVVSKDPWVPRDLYTVAKRVKTQVMSYRRYCDIIDVMFMTIELHEAGRMAASVAYRLSQAPAAD